MIYTNVPRIDTHRGEDFGLERELNPSGFSKGSGSVKKAEDIVALREEIEKLRLEMKKFRHDFRGVIQGLIIAAREANLRRFDIVDLEDEVENPLSTSH